MIEDVDDVVNDDGGGGGGGGAMKHAKRTMVIEGQS
jgi:hypothetical protein